MATEGESADGEMKPVRNTNLKGHGMVTLNGIRDVFLGGALGPVLVELLKIAALGDGRKVAFRWRRISYWIGTFAIFVVSGIVTVLHGVQNVPLLTAVQLGTSAPLLVGAWASAKSVRERPTDKQRFLPEMPSEDGRIASFARLFSWW